MSAKNLIIKSLLERPKTIQELSDEIGVKYSSVKRELHTLKGLGGVEADGEMFSITDLGAQFKLSPRNIEWGNQRDLMNILPIRVEFTIRDAYDLYIKSTNEAVTVDCIGNHIRGLYQKGKIVRVLGNGARGIPGKYIAGLKEGEQYCSNCHSIKPGHGFDDFNREVEGAVCIQCMSHPKQTTLTETITPTVHTAEIVSHQKSDPLRDIVESLYAISSHTSHLKVVSDRAGIIETSIREIGKIMKNTNEVLTECLAWKQSQKSIEGKDNLIP
jgi:DNA-binding transcriptional ArsR family regulator